MKIKITQLVLAVIILIVTLPGGVMAQDSGRAGLIVVGEDGQPLSACVAFPGSEISSYDLLVRSGFDLTVNASGAGTAVCGIGGSGCPASDCFCACKGGADCSYWSFWQRQDEEWIYAQVGAAVSTVSTGEVNGWVWGAGSPNLAPEPPPITFADICSLETGAAPPIETAPERSNLVILAAGLGILLLIGWVINSRVKEKL